jgi:serine/threonine protein kinase/Tol biopolymer transport system component
MIGKTLGHYQISSQLGKGGMGEVYRARDTKLNREVALKVLPEEFASDPERMARFKREAQLLASLNHTNIASIYGLEESGEVRALVMELAEGPTLADRISKGLIPLDEALPIARQIAEALEAAHEKGIIHRDLKPANIKVPPEGAVKVLDFGLAKAMEGEAAAIDASQSPTLSLAATKAGVILGTAAYMSPEQARGSAVDKRCDIWSFGIVLFEMLTGKQLFAGETVSDTLAAVLRADVDWNLLPASIPASIRALLRRCLAKDRKQRLQAIGEARIVIEEYISNPSGASFQETAAVACRHGFQEKLGWIFAVVFGIAVIVLAILYFTNAAVEEPIKRLQVMTPPTSDPVSLAISPDGRYLAFVGSEKGKQQLILRLIEKLEVTPLEGTEGAVYPFWSPDSKSIGFFADRKLKRIEAAGGPPVEIADAPNARGGTWNKDDLIVFAPNYLDGLYSVSAKPGSQRTLITKVDSESHQLGHIFPQFLPDGHQLLFFAWGGKPGKGIYLASLDSPNAKRLPIESDMPAFYAQPGYLLFMLKDSLFAQRFDAKRSELTGNPALVDNFVECDASLYLGGFSTSDTGILAYRTAAAGPRELVWFDRSGKQVGKLGEPHENSTGLPELNHPKDTSLVMNRDDAAGSSDIWLIDTVSGRETRLQSHAIHPVWSPDSSKIVFCSSSIRDNSVGDLYINTLSTDKIELLPTESRRFKVPLDWSKDPQYILYSQLEEGTTGFDIYALQLLDERKRITVANTTSNEVMGKFSPDAKWVAFESYNESGKPEIYIQQFPGPGARQPVSKGGGIAPRWSYDGRELFYICPGDKKLMVVTIGRDGQNLKIGEPVELFSTQIAGDVFAPGRKQYDVSSSSQRFLINTIVDEPAVAPITIVTNWTKALKK